MKRYPHEQDASGRDVHLPSMAMGLMMRLTADQLRRLVRMLSVLALNRDRHERGVMARFHFERLLEDSKP